LKNYSGENTTCLSVYGHHLPTTYSVVMNDEMAVLTPYPMAEKADDIPAYIYRNIGPDAYFASIKRDVDALLQSTTTKKLYPEVMI
jgi:F420-0:gamma-glutamyl ligase